jgi:hypothetical protein
MWDEWPFTFPAAYEIQIHAVDPTNPAVIFASTYSPNTLLRSENFGQSFALVLTTEGYVSAFVMSADGSRAWASDTSTGMHRSDDGGHSFSPLVAAPHPICLATDGGAIYACASRFLDDYVLGRSAAGAAFEPMITWFNEIDGPVDCPAGTEVNDSIWCEPQWPALQASFGGGRPPDGGTIPPDASTGSKPNGNGCGCSTSSAGAAGAALAFGATLTAWLGRRLRRRLS